MTDNGLGRLGTRQDYRSNTADCSNPANPASGAQEENAQWHYDFAVYGSSTNGLGRLTSVTDSESGYRQVPTFDTDGRLSTTETRPGSRNERHHEKTTYDEYGRVFQVFDATRKRTDYSDHGVRRVYNANGHSSIVKGNHTTAFAYGPHRARFKRTDTVTQGTGADATTRTTTTLYIGSVEKITRPNNVTQIKRHIGGVVIETIGSADGGCAASDQNAVRYVLRDHLGGVDVLTDAMGNIDQEMSFDAWGRRRNAATWQGLADAATVNFDHCATTRGFTDHEMLDEVGVVHMNGRIYDPTLARFLQADPFVQFPSNLQNHNRYSYVLNNPLSYTDPTGYFLGKLIRPLASIAISIWLPGAGFWAGSTLFAANGIGAVAVSGFIAGAVASGNLEGAAIGAFSAAAFHGIGSISFEGGFAARAGEGVLGTKLTSAGLALKSGLHGAAGGLMSVLQGGRFGHGFISGFTTQAASGHIGGLKHTQQRVMAAAVLGGTVSAATGGKFANGAITGAFSRGFNDELESRRTAAQEEERQARVRWIRAQIVARAEQAYADGEPYGYNDTVGLFRRNTNKCNKFVCDVANAAGATIELNVDANGHAWPPLAGTFGNKSADIAGWRIVNDAQPGDIVAQRRGYRLATGHVGIIVDDQLNVISARTVGVTKLNFQAKSSLFRP